MFSGFEKLFKDSLVRIVCCLAAWLFAGWFAGFGLRRRRFLLVVWLFAGLAHGLPLLLLRLVDLRFGLTVTSAGMLVHRFSH